MVGVMASMSFYPLLTAAQLPFSIPFVNKPFGGRITKIQACAEPPGLILHVGPPFSIPGFENLWPWGGQYFLNPATSIIHPYGVVTPRIMVLGNATPIAITCVGAKGGGGGFVLTGLAGQGLVEIAEFFEIATFITLPVLGPISLITIGIQILDVLGVSFFKKKPPTYGPAYPIIRIGTGLVPI